ncbi:hypothetical protein L208DRAFT_777323 [Tricholoma matsutake]|nr:hypothetical protein L208DRAFT_777323 [Tricholoma matsutake 945]
MLLKGPSETRGLRQFVLSHFDVFTLQGLQFGYGRTLRREAYGNLFFCISKFLLCRGYNIGPSETRGLSQSVLLHFEVFALQMLQFGSGRTRYMLFKWPSESRGLY